MGNGEKMTKHGALTVLFVLFVVGMFLAMPAQPAIAAMLPEGIGGRVVDAVFGTPIQGVTVSGGGTTSVTDANGNYWLSIYAYGSFTVTAPSTTGTVWIQQSKSASITKSTGYGTANFALNHKSDGFYGRVTDEKGIGLSGATIVLYWYHWGAYQGSFTVNSITYGWYWWSGTHTGGTADTYTTTVTPPTGYWTVTKPATYWYAPVTRQDFVCQSDLAVYVPIAAIFCTMTSTTHDQLTITLGSGGTQTVNMNCAGSSFSTSQAWTSSVSYPGSDQKSFYLLRQVIVTGTYSYALGKATSCSVRQFTNVFKCDYTQSEPTSSAIDPATGKPSDSNYAGVNTNVNGISTSKGHLDTGINGNMQLWVNPYEIKKTTTTSTTYSLGVTIGLTYGVSITIGGSFSFGSSSNNAIVADLWNTASKVVNGVTVGIPHDYKWYLEGSGTSGGVILHVWDMGATP